MCIFDVREFGGVYRDFFFKCYGIGIDLPGIESFLTSSNLELQPCLAQRYSSSNWAGAWPCGIIVTYNLGCSPVTVVVLASPNLKNIIILVVTVIPGQGDKPTYHHGRVACRFLGGSDLHHNFQGGEETSAVSGVDGTGCVFFVLS